MHLPVAPMAATAATAPISAPLRTPVGTAFTMEQTHYRDRIESHGLKVLIPPDDDRAAVHRIIYEELCLGVLRDDSRQIYRDVIGRLVAAGAQGIILVDGGAHVLRAIYSGSGGPSGCVTTRSGTA
jgi:aspartate racemase